MIPFASQRGGGQDLATHLMNAHDNAEIELFQMRGAIARDLHGALAEWEAIAKALTRARQYLCSLSVNPDELQGRLTRAQYLDYIDRAEKRLGLAGQPRAIVFHRKRGEDGRLREHCHVVWSRTDVAGKRAVPLSFFKEKLMTVTREFARDHGLTLPAGYHRQEERVRRRNRQLSAYDCVKQTETGVSHEQRMAAVTYAWRRSDSGKAFVAALEDLGYVLARGRNKTRLVLVDFYGHTTALTRLIDDPDVRARHVRAFLGDYAPDDLPSVEEAQDQAAQRRMAIEAFEKARRDSEQAADLAGRQAARRKEVDAQATALRRRHHDERVQLAAAQKDERQTLKSAYLAAQKRIRVDRARRRPRGLAAFLGRVSGVALVTRKVQRYRDRKRYAAYLVWRDELKRRQRQAREALAERHAWQAADIQRRLRALDRIEQREREAQAQTARKERRRRINARHVHMPPLAAAAQETAQSDTGHRRHSKLARELAEAAALLKHGGRKVDLAGAFARAADDEDGGEGRAGESGALHPDAEQAAETAQRGRLAREFTEAASDDQDDGEAGDSHADTPNPPVDPQPPPPRRRKWRSEEAGEFDRDDAQAFDEECETEQDQERPPDRRRSRDPGHGL